MLEVLLLLSAMAAAIGLISVLERTGDASGLGLSWSLRKEVRGLRSKGRPGVDILGLIWAVVSGAWTKR